MYLHCQQPINCKMTMLSLLITSIMALLSRILKENSICIHKPKEESEIKSVFGNLKTLFKLIKLHIAVKLVQSLCISLNQRHATGLERSLRAYSLKKFQKRNLLTITQDLIGLTSLATGPLKSSTLRNALDLKDEKLLFQGLNPLQMFAQNMVLRASLLVCHTEED